MNKEKQTYLSPETETLVVRFEGMVCTSPYGTNSTNRTEYFTYGDDDYNEL